jgi:NifU-like protein involved in Fe-S cluster formation
VSAALYTPELLALAVSLADYPLADDLPLRGEARSRTCGSTLSIGIEFDAEERISRLGMQVAACAVGQAAAAIFAQRAPGRDPREVLAARDAIAAWLADGGPLPDWPGIASLMPARDFPGRHGAVMLPWIAASAALSKLPAAR